MTEKEASSLLTALYDTWHRPLVVYAARHAVSLEAAEDIVQETFMLLYEALRAGREIANPKGWTLTVVRRKICREVARPDREGSAIDVLDIADPSQGAPAMDSLVESGHLRQLLSVLTAREREVIFLRLAAMKYRQIASELGISGSAVNTLLARALRKLQRAADALRDNKGTSPRYVEKTTPDTLQ